MIGGITLRKLLAFALVGCLAGATYAGLLFVALEYLHWPVFFGSAIAFAIAIPVSYIGNRRLTFRSRNLVPAELTRFICVQGINLALTSAIVHFASAHFPSPFYAKVLVAVIAAPIVSFVLFEIWVYRPRHKHRLPTAEERLP